MKLLVRPAPQPVEALPDYAGRLADANGLTSSAEICAQLRADPSAGTVCDVAPDELMEMDLCVRDSQVYWRNVQFAATDLLRRSAAICPHCLEESPFRPVLWRFYWAVSCTTHRCLFIDQCPRCEAPLVIGGGTAMRCRCGYDLRNAGASYVTEDVLHFQILIDDIFLERAALSPQKSGVRHLAAPVLRDSEGLALLRRAVVLTQEEGMRPRGSSPAALEYRLRRVRALARVFQLGPVSIAAAWHEMWAQSCAEQQCRGFLPGRGQSLADFRLWCLASPEGTVIRALGESLQYRGAQMPRRPATALITAADVCELA